MPLSTILPNISDSSSPSRKRALGELVGMESGVKNNEFSGHNENKENGLLSSANHLISPPVDASPASLQSSSRNLSDSKSTSPKKPTTSQNPISAFFSPTTKQPAPQKSTSADTDTDANNQMSPAIRKTAPSTSTPKKRKLENNENSPLSPAVTQGAPGSARQPDQPPSRKKRTTKEEIEAKKKEETRLREEKEALRQIKAAEKAAKEAELAVDKQQKAEERERKRRQREEEANKKKEELAKKQTEKEKKARSQPTLGSFFNRAPVVPKEKKLDVVKAVAATAPAEDSEDKKPSLYEQMFQPFFVKESVTVAPLFYADEQARETKGRIFEEYVQHRRGYVAVQPFNLLEALELPYAMPRGHSFPTVRDAMVEFLESSARKPIDLTAADSQNIQVRNVCEVLQEIPMKLLCFKEDVRPPYYGTVTNAPGGLQSLRKLARNPVAKDVLPLNYDYDSEAEWQEDDGEDVDLADEEEEDIEDDEGMDDFLDDSEDVGLTRLPQVSGLEPEASGICWENRNRLGPSATMYKYRMEFILGKPFYTTPFPVRNSSVKAFAHAILEDTLDHHSGIDPVSTAYWEKPKPTSTPVALALNATKANSILKSAMSAPAPADALKMLAAAAAVAPHKGRQPTVVLQGDMLQKLKDMVVARKGLSKVGIIELFNLENKVPKSAIKTTLEIITMKAGKDWVLRPDA